MLLAHKQCAFKASVVNDDGTFSGYGSVFGNVDSAGEVVAPGAFTKSLAEIARSGDPLPALWQHQADSPIGGYDTLSQDARGLRLEGWLMVNEVPLARQAHALLKRRVIKGLSIGYYVRDSTFDQRTGVRTLTDLDLVEISIVTFPANPEAQVESVKAVSRPTTTRDFEASLRDLGFSRKEAARIAVRGFADFAPDASPEMDEDEMREVFARLNATCIALKGNQ